MIPGDTSHVDGRTLDPEDWDDFECRSHALLSDLLTYLKQVRSRPAWVPVPDHIKARFREPAPWERVPLSELIDRLRSDILPYATGNIHPRFFGWVHGTGTAEGVLAEMVAATINSNVGGREHVAPYVERQVLDWFKNLFQFPPTAGGILVSGTSMANILGLAVARDAILGASVSREGLSELGQQPIVYSTEEHHVSIRKACQLLGLGSRAVRRLPVDELRRMSPDALVRAIDEDRRMGRIPLAVVGTVGTTNTGSIDPIQRLADIARSESLWLHVDGALGGALVLSDTLRPLLAGVERADSIGFDFHKWMHVPYDAGCVLFRDAELQRRSFAARDPYLESTPRGIAAGDVWFCDYGPELSRSFRALKIWTTLKAHGLKRLGQLVERNCSQARLLARLLERTGRFSLAAPVVLNILVFRPLVRPGSRSTVEEATRELAFRLQESGVGVLTSTTLDGTIALRAAITNHRTNAEDVSLIVAELERQLTSIERGD